MKKCAALINTGKQLEGSLHIGRYGQFTSRPQNIAGLINEPFAAGVIYPAVLAAWTYFALVFARPQDALWATIFVFVAFFACTLSYDFRLRSAYANQREERATKAIP